MATVSEVYVGREIASKLETGSAVAFNAILNREGKPNAAQLQHGRSDFGEKMPEGFADSLMVGSLSLLRAEGRAEGLTIPRA